LIVARSPQIPAVVFQPSVTAPVGKISRTVMRLQYPVNADQNAFLKLQVEFLPLIRAFGRRNIDGAGLVLFRPDAEHSPVGA
jgi:hypothetical protein